MPQRPHPKRVAQHVVCIYLSNKALARYRLIDIVLLPVQGRVGLNNDALASSLLEFFDQRGFARLEGLSDLRVDAERQALRIQV